MRSPTRSRHLASLAALSMFSLGIAPPCFGGVTFLEASRAVGIAVTPECPTCQPPITSELFGFFQATQSGPPGINLGYASQTSTIAAGGLINAIGAADLSSPASAVDAQAASTLELLFSVEDEVFFAITGSLFAAAGDESASVARVRVEAAAGVILGSAVDSGVPDRFGFQSQPVALPLMLGEGDYRLVIDAQAFGFEWAFDVLATANFNLRAVFIDDPAPCPGDIDGNGVVDGADLGLLLASWGTCPDCPVDLNANDVVDGADLGLLLALWGPCANQDR